VDYLGCFNAGGFPDDLVGDLGVVVGQLLTDFTDPLLIETGVELKERLPKPVEGPECLPELALHEKEGIRDFRIEEHITASIRVPHRRAEVI
jgi:hypothetical protein